MNYHDNRLVGTELVPGILFDEAGLSIPSHDTK